MWNSHTSIVALLDGTQWQPLVITTQGPATRAMTTDVVISIVGCSQKARDQLIAQLNACYPCLPCFSHDLSARSSWGNTTPAAPFNTPHTPQYSLHFIAVFPLYHTNSLKWRSQADLQSLLAALVSITLPNRDCPRPHPLTSI